MWEGCLGNTHASGGSVEVFQKHLAHRSRTCTKAFDRRVDCVVTQLTKETGLPVVQRTLWIAGVQHTVKLTVRHRTNRIHDRWAEFLEWTQCLFTIFQRTTMTG